MKRIEVGRVAALLMWGALGCGAPPGGSGDADPAVAAARPAPLVESVSTARVRRGEISTSLTVSGSVVARRSSPLGPSVAGRVMHVFVEVGDEVPFGGPVFQIDPGPYGIALKDAEARLAMARAEQRSTHDEAARTERLSKQNMVSVQEHERALTRVAVAKAQIAQAQAHVERARDDMARTLVLAPYAGSIVERRTHEGTMATVRPNTVVVVLQESGVLEALLDVPESAVAAVRPGDGVRLLIEGVSEPLESRVRSVSDRIDAQSRTYAIRVPVENRDGLIKAGAFARAEVEPQPHSDSLLVDRAAVTRREGRAYVFRVSDGVAEQVPIRVGVTGRAEVEILSGVEFDDELVVGEIVSRLSDGTRVQVVGPPSAALAGSPGGVRP